MTHTTRQKKICVSGEVTIGTAGDFSTKRDVLNHHNNNKIEVRESVQRCGSGLVRRTKRMSYLLDGLGAGVVVVAAAVDLVVVFISFNKSYT